MKLINISLEMISHLKGNSFFNLTCDGCSCVIPRQVKEVRRCIKIGKQLSFCSNKCQGKTLKINKTKTCQYCDSTFEYNFPTQKYCSKTCGNHHREHTEKTKKKISNSLKERKNILLNLEYGCINRKKNMVSLKNYSFVNVKIVPLSVRIGNKHDIVKTANTVTRKMVELNLFLLLMFMIFQTYLT